MEAGIQHFLALARHILALVNRTLALVKHTLALVKHTLALVKHTLALVKHIWHWSQNLSCSGQTHPGTGQTRAFLPGRSRPRPPQAMAVTKMSGAHWRGDASGTPLQRVYGVAFPDRKGLAAYRTRCTHA